MNGDLTRGKPAAVLWRFCLPLFGSIVFQQLYNLADSLVAGRFIGENALAAVGNSYEITLVYLAFGFGCSAGCSIISGWLFGSKEYGELKTAVSTTMLGSAVICAVLMTAGFLFGAPLLKSIDTPENLLADSLLYLNIYTAGFPFLMFYNIATGVFSALGDSATPFRFLACSSTANILLDILFVSVFRMGVAGVAWATFLCQGCSCIIALAVLFRRLRALPSGERFKLFSFGVFKRISAVAVPGILQQGFISVGNIIIQGIINRFGAGVIAGYAASVKLNNLVITSFTTIGSGVSSFTAQNLGAGRPDRVREGFSAGVLLVWALTVPLAAAYFFGGGTLVRFFIPAPTAEALETGTRFLRVLAPFYFAISAKLIADGILKGAQKMTVFMIATFTDLILRTALAAILSKTALGVGGIRIAWPAGWSTATVLSLVFYFRAFGRKKNGSPHADDAQP